MSDDPYLFPGTKNLRNKFGIRNADLLDYHEREITTLRARQGVPTGIFDLKHLRAIHRHLFQDVYDWAGEIRTLEISKGASQFQFCKYIETGMADVHRRLVKVKYFAKSSQSGFAEGAGEIIGDVNYVHPFREGNVRAPFPPLDGEGPAEGRGWGVQEPEIADHHPLRSLRDHLPH